MKKLSSFILALFSLCSLAQTPMSQFVLDLDVKLDDMIAVGKVPDGVSTIIPIVGGTFEGPSIKGTIVSGGADYQKLDPSSNICQLNAIYTIRTDDDVNILVNNQGIVSGNYFWVIRHFE